MTEQPTDPQPEEGVPDADPDATDVEYEVPEPKNDPVPEEDE